MRVLIIEDEAKIALALAEAMLQNGCAVTISHSGEPVTEPTNDDSYDVVLLDLKLPGKGGIEMITDMRKRGVTIPILVFTASSAVADRIGAFAAGADDYLVKPVAIFDILARLRRLEHRASLNEYSSLLQVADLRLDLHSQSVMRGTAVLPLTLQEVALLEYLLRNWGTVVSPEMLTRDVFNMPICTPTLRAVIDVHIARIRRKVDEPFAVKLIHTVRGMGFIAHERDEPFPRQIERGE
jgi:DNA-binding response OmpR family regulator